MRIQILLVLILLGCATPSPPVGPSEADGDSVFDLQVPDPVASELVLRLDGPTLQIDGAAPVTMESKGNIGDYPLVLGDALYAFKTENERRVRWEGLTDHSFGVLIEVGEGVEARQLHQTLFAIGLSGITKASLVSLNNQSQRIDLYFPKICELSYWSGPVSESCEKIELNLGVDIRDDGYHVTINGAPIAPLNDCPAVPNICLKDGAHDIVGLEQVTTRIAHHQSGLRRLMTVGTSGDWPAENLIQVIDSVQGDIWPVSLGISQKGHP